MNDYFVKFRTFDGLSHYSKVKAKDRFDAIALLRAEYGVLTEIVSDDKPDMSIEHYIAIAAGFKRQLVTFDGVPTIGERLRDTLRAVVYTSAEMICDVAKQDNANFDRAWFLSACGF